MKPTRKQLDLIQLIAGGVLVLISALLAADPVRTSLGLWFGGLWLLLARRFGLSPLLMALLVFCALRGAASGGLPALWFLSVNLGLSAFTLSFFFRTRWSALLVAVLWTAVFWGSPSLILLVLTGLPRFRKDFGEQSGWFLLPALAGFLAVTGFHLLQGLLGPLSERPLDAETYEALQTAMLRLFSVESLWRILPMVGIFEVAQKEPDDHRVSWQNLLLAGALVSLLLVPVTPALEMVFLVGLPLSALMLTRWCLALPDLCARSLYWMGLALLALPFLQEGLR